MTGTALPAPCDFVEPLTQAANAVALLLQSSPAWLVERDALNRAANELAIALAPAAPSIVHRALELLVAAYPNWRPPAEYLAPLIADLSLYPSDAIVTGTTEVRRTSKTPPSHARIISAVKAQVSERETLRARIAAELEARDQAAEAARRRMEQERAEAARLVAIEGRFAQLGETLLAAGAYRVAERYLAEGSQDLFDRWRRAIDLADAWAIALAQRAYIAAAVTLSPMRRSVRVALLRTAKTDVAAAIAVLEADPDHRSVDWLLRRPTGRSRERFTADVEHALFALFRDDDQAGTDGTTHHRTGAARGYPDD